MRFNEFPLFLVMEHVEAACNGTKAEQVPVSSPGLHRAALCHASDNVLVRRMPRVTETALPSALARCVH